MRKKHYIDEHDRNKSVEDINREIEAQLLEEKENNNIEKEDSKKKKRAIFSIAGVISIFFLLRLLYNMFHYFFV